MRKPHLDLFAFPTRLFESFGLGERVGDIAGILMQIAGNLPRRRVGATPQFESTDIAVGFGGAIAKRTAVDDRAGGVQQLSIWTDIDVALSIEDEVSAAEGAVRTRRLVPHRDVRGYLAIDQPLEQPDRTINSVGCEPLWLKVESGFPSGSAWSL